MYAIPFFLIGILVLLNALYAGEYLIAQSREDATVINVAGRQRMLSQRIAKFSAEAQLQEERGQTLKNLQETVRQWSEAHDDLHQGSLSSFSGENNSETVKNLFADLNPLFNDIVMASQEILRAEISDDLDPEEAFETIRLKNETYLLLMNQIVNQYEAEAVARVNTNRVVSYGMSGIFVLLIILIWFVVARPAIRSARHLASTKTEIISLAAHQLRTPLSTLNWYVEMILSGDAGRVPKAQKEFLGEIQTSSNRMARIVDQLLDVSRIDLGTVVIQPTSLHLEDVAARVIDEMKPQIEERKQEVELAFKSETRKKKVPVDEALFEKILRTLVSNASKYTPQGGEIDIRITKKEHQLEIKVSDTGMGIPEEERGKIFTKLFRAKNVKELDKDGTGLSLYIIKSMIQTAGGKISFTSGEGAGAEFVVVLPVGR